MKSVSKRRESHQWVIRIKLMWCRKWLCFLPMYHAMAQTIMIAGGPKQGIPVYIMKKFDFIGMLEAIQKFKITTLTMVPPIVVVCLPIFATDIFSLH